MSNPTTLAIEGELTIYRAAELRQALLAALDQHGADLEVDLAGVTEFDSAGVQLLMAAAKSAAARGGVLRLVRHSPAVLDAFAVLDLAAHFGAPLNPPASH
ncbi:STAS domain-containing protein [Rubrivivax gelatinosus]|uniref:Anti-anti-sigma factor n=1 Tax=Rubrivivax gelatinosus TaxID=28068 RepID=A0A4V2SGM5_RUBGE|nr:STAS domain-containing protein [Rubrivivax gelatinosus]MBK1689658.1 anti-sigma B factor antagonist [Rubrivivax gelatinosus]TCP01798.1 anti-anti-sigma factor [Rubrivivax gelatinosus]